MPPHPVRLAGHASSRRVLLGLAALAAVLAACSTADTSAQQASGMPANDACRAPEPDSTRPVAGSFEEANLQAGGELFRIYGAAGDPVREQVTGNAVDIDGQPAWKLDGTYAVTVDGERRSDAWMLWIGFANGQLTVLCAEGPADVAWPPAGDPDM